MSNSEVAPRGQWVPAAMSTKSLVFDTVFGLVAAIIGAAFQDNLVWAENHAIGRIFAFAVVIPLVARRRYPEFSVVALMAVAVTHMVAGYPILMPADLALLISLYSVAVYGSRWFAQVALAAALVGSVAMPFVLEYVLDANVDWQTKTFMSAAAASLSVAAWALGLVRRSRRATIWAFESRATALGERNLALADRNAALAAERRALAAQTEALEQRNAALQSQAEALDDRAVLLELRARKAETERDQQAQIAAVAERTRIAREMHDIIGHALTGMVFLANSAEYAAKATDDAGAAAKALGTISKTGTDALATMRQLLQVMRDDAGEWRSAEVGTPTPGTIGVAVYADDPHGWHRLILENEQLGMNIEVSEQGQPGELTPPVANALYRITQEALTNVRKHGGDNAEVNIQLDWRRAGFRLVITDTANVEIQQPKAAIGYAGRFQNSPTWKGSGQGLIGMRERATLVGGTLSARATDTGWQVVFEMPGTEVEPGGRVSRGNNGVAK